MQPFSCDGDVSIWLKKYRVGQKKQQQTKQQQNAKNKNKKGNSSLFLKYHEWEILSDLSNVLKYFSEVTTIMYDLRNVSTPYKYVSSKVNTS